MNALVDKIYQTIRKLGIFDLIPDEPYLKLMYRLKMGKPLDLKNPKTFNEKLQWLKLHDRNPEYTRMVDKYEAKAYVAEKIGAEHIIPTLGVWDKFEDIDFSILPNQFVLKTTHDSGGVYICKDKKMFHADDARQLLNKSLACNFFALYREWPYKNVRPRIIAEPYIEDRELKELRDYKFFCFGGQVKCFKVDFDRFIEHHANYFDREKHLIEFGEIVCPPVYEKIIELPKSIDKMKEFAELLSQACPFLRVDFYDVDGKIYFGELTFFPDSGFGKFTSEEWDLKLGEWLGIKLRSTDNR